MNGTRIDDRYAVLERLDRGGASLIFLVEDTREKQARRVLRLLARSERRDSTLDRELGNLASVAHPSLQRVHDSGFTDFALPDVQGRFSYVVLERVLGSPIKTVAAHASWDLFVQLATQLLSGLASLHGKGLVHGGISPENVIVVGQGLKKTAKLLDPGLAALGFADARALPRFIAPEVHRGAPRDERADLYALGAVLAEAATQTIFLPGEKLGEGSRGARTVPPPLAEVLESLVARDAAARPASANAVLKALGRIPAKRLAEERRGRREDPALGAIEFLGRHDALGELEALAARALRNRPGEESEGETEPGAGIAIVSGKTGSGKARLVRELTTRLRARNTAVLEAHALVSRSPILDLVARALVVAAGVPEDLREVALPLGRLLPDLGLVPLAPLEPGDERLRVVLAAARTLLACARKRPLVVVLRDLHAADALTVDVLLAIASELAAARRDAPDRPPEALAAPEPAPLLVLATLSREDLAGRLVEPALAALSSREGVREIALESLPEDTLHEIALSAMGGSSEELGGLAREAATAASGSPGALVEILEALAASGKLGRKKADSAPLDLEQGAAGLARTRLARLDDHERALLEALALVPSCDQATLALALGVEEAELPELLDALRDRRVPVLVEKDAPRERARISLASASLREAALAELAPDARAALADSLGAAFATRARSLEDPRASLALAEEAARTLLDGSRARAGAPFARAVARELARSAVPERAADLLGLALGAATSAGRGSGEPLDARTALGDLEAPAFVSDLPVQDLELALLLDRGDALLAARGSPCLDMASGRAATEARADFERALTLARARRRPRETALALLGSGRAAVVQGDARALARFDEAAAIAREIDWPQAQALALEQIGLARLRSGDLEDAATALDEAARILEQRQDRESLARVLRASARTHEERGDVEAAKERLARSRALDEEDGRPGALSEALARLAVLEAPEGASSGGSEQALALARSAIERAKEARCDSLVAQGLAALGRILRSRGRSATEAGAAIEYLEAALETWERLGSTLDAAQARHDLALVLASRGQHERSLRELEAAGSVFAHEKRPGAAALARIHQAGIQLALGNVANARESLESAARDVGSLAPGERSKEGRLSALELEVARLRAEIAFAQGDLARAEGFARVAADGAARTGRKSVECLARLTLGALRHRRGRPFEAQKEILEASELARSLGESALEARSRLALASVHLSRAEPRGAIDEAEAARDTAQRTGEPELEVRSLLALGSLHAFLGETDRALSILEQASERAKASGLGLARPEIALASAEALLDAMAGRDRDRARIARVRAILEEAEKDARAGSRRALEAEVDLSRARTELLSGNARAALERAQQALEAAGTSGDSLLEAHAELLVGEARLASGQTEEAIAVSERALARAEQSGLGEVRSGALLLRGKAALARGSIQQAARDLRDAASAVRATWSALPEILRASYAGKPLAREVRSAAEKVLERAEPAAARSPSGERARLGSESSESTASSSPDALLDPLTGLKNHAYFSAQLETEIKRSVRHARPLSLLKMGIDRFELVRELEGAERAKRVIRDIGQVLERSVRDVDVLARSMGDEFEALLPDTDPHGAVLAATRLREAVEQAEIVHEGERLSLTISVGAATFPKDGADKDALVCRADEAFENARAHGPNRTFSFGAPRGKEKDGEKGSPEAEAGLREIDTLLLSREGRLVLSMVQKIVSQELDLDKLVSLTTAMVVEATRGERGFFMLAGKDGELHVEHGKNMESGEGSPEIKVSHGIAREVARTGEPVLIAEAIEDDRFREFKSVIDLKLRSIICAPIVAPDGEGKQETIGVIYVDHNAIARRFTKEDLRFLEAIAGRVAIPLRNSKVLRDTEEQLADARARLKTSQDQLETKYRYDKIVGKSEPMQRVFRLLDKIVETHHSVVIHGESGTGKELIARAIHFNGPRKNKPFVAENCAALTDTLLEAELFGHVRGAFTGADRDSKGLFELANGGTLFLDEIGDMSEPMQKKLLRVLQEGEVRPVGGKRVLKIDVRVISASNKDLKRLVQENEFREDLYYRLNVITVNLPPLRERREDVPVLVERFLQKSGGDAPKPIDKDVLRLLAAYDWPGNVRELENEVNRMVAMSDARIDMSAVSPRIRDAFKVAPKAKGDDGLAKYYDKPLKDVEFEVMRDIILRTLERTNWHRTQAAKILHVPTSTLFNKMKKYGIG